MDGEEEGDDDDRWMGWRLDERRSWISDWPGYSNSWGPTYPGYFNQVWRRAALSMLILCISNVSLWVL